jgi:membrane-associated phospholipid phosphatase
VENYWMALARDVPFDQYGLESVTQAAITEIAGLSDWRGPAPSASTLFRGSSPGCSVGPYLSQFFYLNDTMGANMVDPRITVYSPGVDFMTDWTEFLSIQNGNPPTSSQEYVPNFSRYMINGRDISRWVHMDVLFQAYMQAGVILMNMGAPLKAGLPYVSNPTQMGFATFGPPHYLNAIVEISDYALRAVWFQKWYVHRRLRPEEAGGLVDRTKRGLASYPLDADIINSVAVTATWTKFASYLLPQAFPEGCPAHPSYGAGHATVAGACITLLKFWFDEDFVFPAPVAPSADGSTLNPLIGATLTVGGELNKLANNVAFGRNIAGVHWRSDAEASLLLGEQLAVSFLQDQKATYHEVFGPWTATGFDGTLLTVN